MDDLISRQAAIDAIDKRVQFLKDDPVFRRKHGDIDLYGIKPIIRALPSAQPEHRTGNWQDRRIIATNGNSLGIFRCSGCKRASTITTAFCPNCGADMRGETDR